MTYVYSCKDIDMALNYTDDKKSSLELYAHGTNQGEYKINVDEENNEVVFGEKKALEKGAIYTIKYKRILNKVETTSYIAESLVTQKFEGITDLGEIQYTVKYDTKKYANKLIIDFEGRISDLERVAGARIELKHGDVSYGISKLVKLFNYDNGKYYTEVDLLSILNDTSVIDKEIEVKVYLYYDNGCIGYEPFDKSGYFAYQSTKEDGLYKYMTLTEKDKFVETNVINSNVFSLYKNQTANVEGFLTPEHPYYDYICEQRNLEKGYAYLLITDIKGNSKVVQLKYSGQGFMYEDKIIVQKNLARKLIDTTVQHTIEINSIVVGIKVNSIDVTLTEATIKAEITNTLNLDIGKEIYIEIFESDDKNEIADWGNATIETVDLDSINDFNLTNLKPAKYYKIRFKYRLNGDTDFIYTYDVETNEQGKEYQFETIATIDMNSLNIEYEPINYKEKYLKIEYAVNSKKSSMYQKTKYEFYEYNDTLKEYEKLNLNTNNIWVNTESGNSYEVTNGALYVRNGIYGQDGKEFDKVLEKINISPENNVFTFGNKYKLIITPIAHNGEDDIELESIEYETELKELSDPKIGMKMIRKDSDKGQYVKASITIVDLDCIVSGNQIGEYTLELYKYKKQDKSDKVSVNIYDLPTGGNDITNNIFNLGKHAGNYSIYIQNADFSYNYELNLKINLDRENNNNPKLKTETRILGLIDEETGIDLGSISIIANDEFENKADIKSLDNYRIKDITNIKYNIRNSDNLYHSYGEFTPVWEETVESEITSFATTVSPIEFTEKGTYYIRLDFYKDNIMVGSKEVQYTY